MSVLNQASDGQYNVLITLVRASVRFGPRERSELLGLCGAGVTGVDAGRLNSTFLRWTELGLFESLEGQTVISEPYRGRLGKDADNAEARLPSIAREIVLRADNNQRFWEAEGNKSADLSRGLSWLLAQDVYSIDTSSHAKIEDLESSQIVDQTKRMMQNDTRWNGLKTWAAYLGFGRGESFVVDPTAALRDALTQIFPTTEPMLAQDFLRRTAEILPVLDQGVYRLRVEDALKASAWSALEDHRLSTALSRGVERLVHAGELAMEQRADAQDGLQLTGVNGRSWRSFTHIWRTAGAKGAD
ncbi:MAG: hypothetical protein EON59_06110 [Alphaproteobacteria bacterium]|nr:MAG: hypothetical protein EON59_06110 [Alphaproteobacteria bacterium]